MERTEEKTVQDVIATSLERFRQQFPILPTEPPQLSVNNKIINFILPLAGRYDTFVRFIRNYEEVSGIFFIHCKIDSIVFFQVCLETEEAVAMVIVLFRGQRSEDIRAANQTLDYISALRIRHLHSKLTVIPVDDDFARALALQIGTAYVPNDANNILFYVDVDMVFTRATLERIRRNTIRGKQVF